MKRLVVFAVVLAVLCAVALAGARIRKVGTPPAADKALSFEVSGETREHAILRLAKEAGWKLSMDDPPSSKLALMVSKPTPATEILERLLSDGDYVVTFEAGGFVTIARDTQAATPTPTPPPSATPAVDSATAPTPPVPPVPAISVVIPPIPAVPPVPPVPPVPHVRVKSIHSAHHAPSARPALPPYDGPRGENRSSLFGEMRIEHGDVVHDVKLVSGDLEVLGTVTGRVEVVSGDAHVFNGAHIVGDIMVVSGDLILDDGARVDGNIQLVHGELVRSEGCTIGGSVKTPDARASGDDVLQRAHSILGGSVTQAALFFVFGAVLLALATRRMEVLRNEVKERPMRAFALGVLGFIGFIVLCIALCVTVIGIPFAAVALLLGMFGLGAAMCAALTVVGEMVLRRRTQNPYVHLAFGCALFLVVCKLPVFISVPIQAALMLVGVGTLVSTRLAGMLPKKKRPAEGPYRTPAAPVEDA